MCQSACVPSDLLHNTPGTHQVAVYDVATRVLGPDLAERAIEGGSLTEANGTG